MKNKIHYETDTVSIKDLDNFLKNIRNDNSLRVRQWNEWSDEMHEYIKSKTDPKYTLSDNFDLISISDSRIMVWNILKYAFRLWTGQGKINDLKKICHYAQLAWSLSNGDLSKIGITNEKGD